MAFGIYAEASVTATQPKLAVVTGHEPFADRCVSPIDMCMLTCFRDQRAHVCTNLFSLEP